MASTGVARRNQAGTDFLHDHERDLILYYISTRGAAPRLDFAAATLAGLASDGGLYVPETVPTLAAADIRALAGLSYTETALQIMRPFIGHSLELATLKALIEEAYAGFAHAAIAPLKALDTQHWVLELFHGPTLAFKDFALQLLGQLFEHLLAGSGKRLTILGATSGDTGSAAIHALAGRAGIDIFMLHPDGRVSDVQRRQMTTVAAPNVHNIAISGTFDDCQALVKALFNDMDFRDRHALSAVNSINWARIMAQIVYYFYAAVRLGAPDREVAFSVPTGNFGDVFAGYMALKMGLPIRTLMVATNVNDILYRALRQGDYSTGQVQPTQAPSMDIQVSSNFERLLFDLGGRDGHWLNTAMRQFEQSHGLHLEDPLRQNAAQYFSVERVDADDMALALRWAHERAGELIDPHTAIGLAAARRLNIDPAIPIVTLATAHPAKFRDAVERATGVRPPLPARLAGLFDRVERIERLANESTALKQHIERTLSL